MRRSVYTPTAEMLADKQFTGFLDELVKKARENNVEVARKEGWLVIS